MRPRTRKLRLEHLGGILKESLKKNRIAVILEDRKLRDLWDKAAGPQIAAQTRPESIKRGVLYIKVFSPVWLQELGYLREELLAKIVSSSGDTAVKNIHFSLGERAAAGRPARGMETIPLDLRYLRDRDRKMIQECLPAVADPELREIVRRTMIREITRRRMLDGRSKGRPVK